MLDVTELLEWWPDNDQGPLCVRTGRGGSPIKVASLPLSSDLVERLTQWNDEYDEDKIPVEGPGDPGWLEQGKALLVSCACSSFK
jgi:hypothetical protein